MNVSLIKLWCLNLIYDCTSNGFLEAKVKQIMLELGCFGLLGADLSQYWNSDLYIINK